MEIEFKGANCVVIKDKDSLIVVDPTANVSVKAANDENAVILATQENFAKSEREAKNFVIDMPGEYEHNDISVRGIPAHIHTDKDGKNGTMYRIETKDARIAVIGHTDAPLSDDDLESLGVVDILIIPVGGGGYTLDAKDAATIARQISPKVVIPTHFADEKIKYEVPQEPIENFIKEIGGAHEKQNTLKVKNLPLVMTVMELSRTA
jgi:L-ascorbate metabolism protein UlaG (beta-lactamase superfamily)